MESTRRSGQGPDKAGAGPLPPNQGYEPEVSLFDAIFLLWKHKYSILLAALIPALLVGAWIFFSPREYKIRYLYDMGLGKKAYIALMDKFTSVENLSFIAKKLKEAGFESVAAKIDQAKGPEGLSKIIEFDILPEGFEELTRAEAKDLSELEESKRAKGMLLAVTIISENKQALRPVSRVFLENFGERLPLLAEMGSLRSKIIALKSSMAAIEESRYSLNAELKRRRKTLEKLKDCRDGETKSVSEEVVLQFSNAERAGSYLPLSYQIRAVKTKIVDLEETIKAQEEKFAHNKALLDLNTELLKELRARRSSYYSLTDFHSFLANMLREYDGTGPASQASSADFTGEVSPAVTAGADSGGRVYTSGDKVESGGFARLEFPEKAGARRSEKRDYLSAYEKKIENKLHSRKPVVADPRIFPKPKGTVKRTGIVFLLCLMLAVFGTFLWEGMQKRKAQRE